MSESTAREFLRFCVNVFGLGFHPDIHMIDYVDSDGTKVFTLTVAMQMDGLLTQACLALRDYDVYGVVLDLMREQELL